MANGCPLGTHFHKIVHAFPRIRGEIPVFQLEILELCFVLKPLLLLFSHHILYSPWLISVVSFLTLIPLLFPHSHLFLYSVHIMSQLLLFLSLVFPLQGPGIKKKKGWGRPGKKLLSFIKVTLNHNDFIDILFTFEQLNKWQKWLQMSLSRWPSYSHSPECKISQELVTSIWHTKGSWLSNHTDKSPATQIVTNLQMQKASYSIHLKSDCVKINILINILSAF